MKWLSPLFLLLISGTHQVWAQSKEFHFSCDLDPLLNMNQLWDWTPDKLEQQFASKGFKTSPHFSRRENGDEIQIRFSERPFKNITTDLTVFDDLSAKGARLTFIDGMVKKLRLDFAETNDAAMAEKVYQQCLIKLQTVFDTEPKPWAFKHDPTKARAEMEAAMSEPLEKGGAAVIDAKGKIWQTSDKLALLDLTTKTPGLKSVRLRIVSPDDKGRLETEEFIDTLNSGLTRCSLDPLFQMPKIWRTSTQQFEALFASPPGISLKKNPYFKWLKADKTRAIFYRRPYTNRHIDLRMIDSTTPVEEVIVDFKKGYVSNITISIFNYGDSGEISGEDFQKLHRQCGMYLTTLLDSRANHRTPDTRTGITVKGFEWKNPERGVAILEYNEEALRKRLPEPQYLRLKLMPRITDTMGVRKFQLPKNVIAEDNDDRWIPTIPMVDQGHKGYCVVASCQRVFEYFRIPIDQYQIAPIFKSDADRGTNTKEMEASLKLISETFHTKFSKLMERTFYVDGSTRSRTSLQAYRQLIKTNIDQGIPLLWSLRMNLLPEKGEDLSQADGGGHMRLIIGYNSKDDTIIFSDSWGLGHEKKFADTDAAYKATTRLFKFTPTMN